MKKRGSKEERGEAEKNIKRRLNEGGQAGIRSKYNMNYGLVLDYVQTQKFHDIIEGRL